MYTPMFLEDARGLQAQNDTNSRTIEVLPCLEAQIRSRILRAIFRPLTHASGVSVHITPRTPAPHRELFRRQPGRVPPHHAHPKKSAQTVSPPTPPFSPPRGAPRAGRHGARHGGGRDSPAARQPPPQLYICLWSCLFRTGFFIAEHLRLRKQH